MSDKIPAIARQAIDNEITPQRAGRLVFDPEGTMVGIETEDGRSVLMDSRFARQLAHAILKATDIHVPVGAGTPVIQ